MILLGILCGSRRGLSTIGACIIGSCHHSNEHPRLYLARSMAVLRDGRVAAELRGLGEIPEVMVQVQVLQVEVILVPARQIQVATTLRLHSDDVSCSCG